MQGCVARSKAKVESLETSIKTWELKRIGCFREESSAEEKSTGGANERPSNRESKRCIPKNKYDLKGSGKIFKGIYLGLGYFTYAGDKGNEKRMGMLTLLKDPD